MLHVSLITLGDPATLTGGYLYHRRMADLAPRFDARVEFVSFPDRRFPLPTLAARRVLRAARARADVVLVDSIAAAYLAFSAAGAGRPLAAVLHQPPGGIDHARSRTAVQAALDRRTYRHARRLLVASRPLADQLAREGFGDRLVVVPPGRDVAAPPPGPAADLRAGARTALLHVGNWVPRKGLLDLLDAVARLPSGLAVLHLAGDEDAEPRYAARVRRRLARGDLAGRVVRHGRCDRREVAGLYRDADVFVLPSVREPYGTAYGEAMAAGLPVVGWRAGNLAHLAEHGREGLLLPPGDRDGLAAALWLLAEDERVRARLAAAAQARARSLPTWAHSARLFFTTLREVAGR